MPKKPVKKKGKPTTKRRQPKAKPKPKVRPKPPEIPDLRFCSAGVQAVAMRNITEELTETFEKGGVEAKPVLEALAELKAWAEVVEDRVVELGRKSYPTLKWPTTVAHWQEDLPRISPLV